MMVVLLLKLVLVVLFLHTTTSSPVLRTRLLVVLFLRTLLLVVLLLFVVLLLCALPYNMYHVYPLDTHVVLFAKYSKISLIPTSVNRTLQLIEHPNPIVVRASTKNVLAMPTH